MTCDEFRTAVGAEPHSSRPEVLAHAAQCPACARYREELQAMDQLIHRALQIDVGATPLPGTPAVRTSGPVKQAWQARSWRLAASVLLTAVLVAFASVWLLTPRDTFAAQVVDHILHERGSLVRTSESVDEDSLASVLSRSGLSLKPGAAKVSYAMSCTFRGHRVPHLVVQTERGPVTVLVLTEEPPRTQREQIDEGDFQGMILPAPKGVIVVLGEDVPVDSVAQTVLAALDYGTAGDW